MKLTKHVVFIALLVVALLSLILVFLPHKHVVAHAVKQANVSAMFAENGVGYLLSQPLSNYTACAYSDNVPTRVVIYDKNADQTTNNITALTTLFKQHHVDYTFVDGQELRSQTHAFVIIVSDALPEFLLHSPTYFKQNVVVFVGTDFLVYNTTLKQEKWLPEMRAKKIKRFVFLKNIGTVVDKRKANHLLHLYLYQRFHAAVCKNITTKHIEGALLGSNLTVLRVVEADRIHQSSTNISFRGKAHGGGDVLPGNTTPLLFTVESNRTYPPYVFVIESQAEKKVERTPIQASPNQTTFFFSRSFETPGNYLCSIYDDEGVVSSLLVHVENITVTLKQHVGTMYRFEVLVDGARMQQGVAKVRLSDSKEWQTYQISNGMINVMAAPRPGTKDFILLIAGQEFKIHVPRGNNSLLLYYVELLVGGLFLVAVFLLIIWILRRPRYTIIVPDEREEENEEYFVTVDQALDAIKKTGKWLGLEKVPLTTEEILRGFRKFLCSNDYLFEGNVESILRQLEKRGLVKHKGDFWMVGKGDIGREVLKRKLLDLVVSKGIKFKRLKDGFKIGNKMIVFSEPKIGGKVSRNVIYYLLVEDDLAKKQLLSKMDRAQVAQLKVMMKNNKLFVVTFEELKRLLG